MVENDGSAGHSSPSAVIVAKGKGERPGRRPLILLGVVLWTMVSMASEAGNGTGAAAAQPEAGPERPEGPVIKDGMVDIRRRRTSDLVAACLASQGSSSSWCSAYLMGVADTLTAIGNGGHKGGLCNVDYGIEDLPEVFLTCARANERPRNLDMLAGANIAFRERWPCRG